MDENKAPMVTEGLLRYLKATWGEPRLGPNDSLAELQRKGGGQEVYLHFLNLYTDQQNRGETI